ncbi:MAG: 2-oxo acid dehydrogenase subunit E2 [Saprospiraceae bacterium]|nr:2-oxo acid dehydrogenase subunit E2 [Saprospiraceae bacterium]
MSYEYKLPSMGDGVTGKIINILVKPGDAVTKEQIVVVVGTDKVDAEMPVDAAGVVEEVLVRIGDEVGDGHPILRLKTSEGAASVSAPVPTPTPAPAPPPAAAQAAQAVPTVHAFHLPDMGDGVTGKVISILVNPGDKVEKDQIVLVVGTDKVDAEMPVDAAGTVQEVLVKIGDEVGGGTPVLRLQTSGTTTPTANTPLSTTESRQPTTDNRQPTTDNRQPTTDNRQPTTLKPGLRSSPLARRRAQELGVDLATVPVAPDATRLSYKDVMAYVRQRMSSGASAPVAAGAVAHKALPNFEKFGLVERQEQSRIGVLTADNMVYAFNAIPHAWISEKADITRLEQLRQQYKDQVKAKGGSLTTTAILAKAVTSVLRKMPQFNASYDLEKREVIFKKYYNIGIAVDTPRGLLVPVLRNVDQKSLTEISVELSELSARTRDGKNKPEDLMGGTFSISNIGGIGGTNMLSIVNWPEVAILSITAATHEAVWNGSAFEPRLLMPMTIGWDHRVINGADAARFLQELKSILEEPFLGWL